MPGPSSQLKLQPYMLLIAIALLSSASSAREDSLGCEGAGVHCFKLWKAASDA